MRRSLGPSERRQPTAARSSRRRDRPRGKLCELCHWFWIARSHPLSSEQQAKPHAIFTRRQDDLEVTLEISLLEALVGFTRELHHLDGRMVQLQRDQVVQPNAVWRIAGEGMPKRQTPSQRGDLLVQFLIRYPSEPLGDHERQGACASRSIGKCSHV